LSQQLFHIYIVVTYCNTLTAEDERSTFLRNVGNL